MTAREALSGVLLIDKPAGITSHDVVQKVRRIFGQREVGHAGTLDPFATGLLVLGLGRATRLLRFIEAAEKRYVGTVVLGVATTTLDAEGEVTETRSIEGIGIGEGEIQRALASLRGEIDQRVPAFSAVHVAGERLYARARRGEAVETPVRRVQIHHLEAVRIALPEVDIEARVSKGTYVRALAAQIGDALSVPAHLKTLRRLSVGPFRIEDARGTERLLGVASELVPMERALDSLAAITVDETGAEDVRHGRRLSRAQIAAGGGASGSAGDALRIHGAGGALLAVGILRDDGGLDYACVLVR
ncbi:MAG: tRNA pseudouridine(55) synthase TruB [Deltaproteobacteria bacterium]|nr:tRNA pseudouridine(55) synthase TruB [Deltaproteobacteria bacterium]